MQVTTNIRRLLEVEGLTVATAARQAGIAERTFHTRLKNPKGWTLGELDRLAEVLHVQRSEFG